MKESLVRIENLNITIGLKTILKNTSVALYKQESILLTGENGSGKSTFLKVLFSGHSRKEIFWSPDLKKERVSYLGHELGLYTSLSLEENLNYFSGIIKNPLSNEKLFSITEKFGLVKRMKDPIHTFSEGMKRKAGILRALLMDAELLLLDEPFNGLDTKSSDQFVSILGEILKTSSYIIVSHDLLKFKSIVNRHLHIENGKLEEKNV